MPFLVPPKCLKCGHMLSYNHIYMVICCGQKDKKRKPASSLPAGSFLLPASFHLHLHILVYRNNTFVISKHPSPARLPSACCAPAPPAPEFSIDFKLILHQQFFYKVNLLAPQLKAIFEVIFKLLSSSASLTTAFTLPERFKLSFFALLNFLFVPFLV